MLGVYITSHKITNSAIEFEGYLEGFIILFFKVSDIVMIVVEGHNARMCYD